MDGMTTWLIVVLVILGLILLCSVLIVFGLCAIAGRLDEQEDVYLKEWEERH